MYTHKLILNGDALVGLERQISVESTCTYIPVLGFTV